MRSGGSCALLCLFEDFHALLIATVSCEIKGCFAVPIPGMHIGSCREEGPYGLRILKENSGVQGRATKIVPGLKACPVLKKWRYVCAFCVVQNTCTFPVAQGNVRTGKKKLFYQGRFVSARSNEQGRRSVRALTIYLRTFLQQGLNHRAASAVEQGKVQGTAPVLTPHVRIRKRKSHVPGPGKVPAVQSQLKVVHGWPLGGGW